MNFLRKSTRSIRYLHGWRCCWRTRGPCNNETKSLTMTFGAASDRFDNATSSVQRSRRIISSMRSRRATQFMSLSCKACRASMEEKLFVGTDNSCNFSLGCKGGEDASAHGFQIFERHVNKNNCTQQDPVQHTTATTTWINWVRSKKKETNINLCVQICVRKVFSTLLPPCKATCMIPMYDYTCCWEHVCLKACLCFVVVCRWSSLWSLLWATHGLSSVQREKKPCSHYSWHLVDDLLARLETQTIHVDFSPSNSVSSQRPHADALPKSAALSHQQDKQRSAPLSLQILMLALHFHRPLRKFWGTGTSTKKFANTFLWDRHLLFVEVRHWHVADTFVDKLLCGQLHHLVHGRRSALALATGRNPQAAPRYAAKSVPKNRRRWSVQPTAAEPCPGRKRPLPPASAARENRESALWYAAGFCLEAPRHFHRLFFQQRHQEHRESHPLHSTRFCPFSNSRGTGTSTIRSSIYSCGTNLSHLHNLFAKMRHCRIDDSLLRDQPHYPPQSLRGNAALAHRRFVRVGPPSPPRLSLPGTETLTVGSCTRSCGSNFITFTFSLNFLRHPVHQRYVRWYVPVRPTSPPPQSLRESETLGFALAVAPLRVQRHHLDYLIQKLRHWCVRHWILLRDTKPSTPTNCSPICGLVERRRRELPHQQYAHRSVPRVPWCPSSTADASAPCDHVAVAFETPSALDLSMDRTARGDCSEPLGQSITLLAEGQWMDSSTSVGKDVEKSEDNCGSSKVRWNMDEMEWVLSNHTDCTQQNTSIILSHAHTTRKIACVATW